MVREAIFWRLIQDFPNVSHNQYHTFITGSADKRIGESFLTVLREYQFQDPSVGDGIFMKNFEKKFSKYINSKSALSVANGTIAFNLIYLTNH